MHLISNLSLYKRSRKLLRKNQTNAEKLLWYKIRNRQIRNLKFYRQFSVGKYILDFYCHEKKLAIELDGGQHNSDVNIEHDIIRTRFLNQQGIQVIRYWDNEVLRNINSILDDILKKVE